ncbi:MAG: ATP-binding cassette domain-containing protein [Saprospiraceae bacterium]|uniref:ATP-binding cassette domain-containing protein n=1 Tax=Candidatus Brachybacter algidus TaxID=2982024 RepID=UPI00257F42CF|nr:ABC transporter ATP-binding protein [Candidatus Brachybacter algidus]MBK7603098.1 ATP-binding cassette domain-containing protein [Candidatus Brachybacter algidus]
MQQALFSITNLSCGYNSNRTVLSVDALKIYSGQITFIVGKSGSGKSTMLETLGFMNNTFNSKNANR